MRTAESVVLTLWPPGPLERKTSMRRSCGSIDDLDVLGLGHHPDAGGAGVDAALALGDRHALDAVHPALELQPRPRRLAGRGGAARLHRDPHVLVAAEVGLGGVEHLGAPATALGVPQVHPQQVAGEQGRLLAALPRLDLEDDVAVVVGVARDRAAGAAGPRPRPGSPRARGAPRRRTGPRAASSRAAPRSSRARTQAWWAATVGPSAAYRLFSSRLRSGSDATAGSRHPRARARRARRRGPARSRARCSPMVGVRRGPAGGKRDAPAHP